METDTENDDTNDPVVEAVDESDPKDKARALAEEQLTDADPRRHSICVRCGAIISNQGKRPWPDENGVAWLKCPKRCEPPAGADGSCVPLDDRWAQSVLDPTELHPNDALYVAPEAPAEDDTQESAPDSEPEPRPPRSERCRRPPLRDDL